MIIGNKEYKDDEVQKIFDYRISGTPRDIKTEYSQLSSPEERMEFIERLLGLK